MKAARIKKYMRTADEIKVCVDLGNDEKQYFNATKKDVRHMLKRFADDADIPAHFSHVSKVLTVGEKTKSAFQY